MTVLIAYLITFIFYFYFVHLFHFILFITLMLQAVENVSQTFFIRAVLSCWSVQATSSVREKLVHGLLAFDPI